MKKTDTDAVILRPILGLSPRVYVSVVWALAALALIFLLFVYPGIRRYGSRVSFSSAPSGAAVYVDKAYVGATPLTYFVDAGSREITISKRAFLPFREQQEVKGRLLFSLFPRRLALHADLQLEDTEALQRATLSDLALSSGIVDTTIHPSAPVLEEAVSDLLHAGEEEASAALLVDAIVYLQTQEEAARYRAALDGYLAQTGRTLEAFFDEVFAVYRFLPEELEASLREYQWFVSLSGQRRNDYENERDLVAQGFSFAEMRGTSGARRSFDGVSFRSVRGSSLVSPTQGVSTLGDFYIMEDLVTDELAERLLDSENTAPGAGDSPYAHLSWEEAHRTAEALVLPAGFSARLPTALEWEYAALLNLDGTASIGLQNMGGALWEWTDTWFVPIPSMREDDIDAGYLRELRGGSWISDPEQVGPTMQGAQHPSSATPFLGFRFVVVRG